MTDYMTANDFATKVEWEGGVLDALDYGLKHTNLDPNDSDSAGLRAAWQELEEKFSTVKPVVMRLEAILETFEEADDEEDN